MITSLSLKFDYFTNFSIKANWFAKSSSTWVKLRTESPTKKKVCKYFMLLVTFLGYLNTVLFRGRFGELNARFLIKPAKQNIFNYLKAPYKNKLSRNQLYTPRFKLTIFVDIVYNWGLLVKGPGVLIERVDFLKKNLFGLESNLLYLNKFRVSYKTPVGGYWNYKISV